MEEIENTSLESEPCSIQEKRIDEMGTKFTQILIFLSFVIMAVVTLENVKSLDIPVLDRSLFFWKWALVPTLLGVLPLKELVL
jgi:uncharacterized integral membrane protein